MWIHKYFFRICGSVIMLLLQTRTGRPITGNKSLKIVKYQNLFLKFFKCLMNSKCPETEDQLITDTPDPDLQH
jgi:hypothetical protein